MPSLISMVFHIEVNAENPTFPLGPPPMPNEQHIFFQESVASDLKLFKLGSVTVHSLFSIVLHIPAIKDTK